MIETLWDREQMVRSIVRDEAKSLLEEPYPEDRLSEIVDSSVPIYTSDLMDIAANDINMATLEPELGPAFDGTPTPANIIAANIYEALQVVAYDEWQKVQEEA